MTPEVEYVEVARAESERGELVLRERRPVDGGPTSLELRANGVFVMDTVEVSSERAMAQAALAAVEEPRAVVVGGLGLGYTMHEVLADSRVEKCAVVEIEPALVDWMRAGLVPEGPALLADERVTVVVADVAAALAEAREASYDLVLLDVDNGPGYLVHAANAALYEPPALADARRILRPGGALVVWSAAESADLEESLATVFGTVDGRAPRRTAPGPGRGLLALPRAGTVRAVNDSQEYRTEHDSMGEVKVPREALWRAQTQRAVENFPISGTPIEPALIHAIGEVKAAAAKVNAELGVLDADQAAAIVKAAKAVAAGEHDDAFPIDVFQTGSGTSSNMNANEVIAELAARDADGVDRPPQRPRQRLAVLQRHLPDRDPRGRRASRHRRPAAGPRRTGRHRWRPRRPSSPAR